MAQVDRGQLLAKAFLFPQEQQVAQGRQPSQRQAGLGALPLDKQDEYFGIPKPKDGFQYTGDMRQRVLNYYKNLAAAKQYAREQWTVYGNDVTNPDPTREDSILAAEAFKAALGNLQTEADEMQQSQEMLKPAVALANQNKYAFAPGAFDQPYAQVAGTTQAGQSLEVDPLVQFVGQQAGKDFTNYGQYGQANQAVNQLQSSVTDPRSQVAAGAITPDYTPRAAGGGSGTTSPVTGMVAEWGQLSAGRHPSFTVSERVTPQGSYWLESTDNSFIGKRYGSKTDPKGTAKQFIISKIVTNPDTNETYAVNDQGQQKLLPQDISVSIKDALPSTSIAEYEKYIGELDSQGILPKTRGAGGAVTTQIPGSLFVPQATKQQFEQEVIPQAQSSKQQVQQLKAKVSSDLSLLDSSFWNFKLNPFFAGVPDELEYDSDNGKVNVKNKDGEYTIIVAGSPVLRDKKPVKFTKAQAEKYLSDLNVYGAMLRNKKGELVPAEEAVNSTQTDW